jgi:hypothetical protein
MFNASPVDSQHVSFYVIFIMNVATLPDLLSCFIQISNVFVSSSVHTVRMVIDEPDRILLAGITVFLVCLRIQPTGSVVLLYTDTGSAFKLTLHEVTVTSESRLPRRLHVTERLLSS